jgi:hypothetical protein
MSQFLDGTAYVKNGPHNKIIGFLNFDIERKCFYSYSEKIIEKCRQWQSLIKKMCSNGFIKTDYFDLQHDGYKVANTTCKMCFCVFIGTMNINFNGFTFSEELFHYITEHNIEINKEFIDMIENSLIPLDLCKKEVEVSDSVKNFLNMFNSFCRNDYI